MVGSEIQLLKIDISSNGEELVARCRRTEVVQDLSLSDLVFPADQIGAWIHAAYRRCRGLTPYPADAPEDWQPFEW
ncbi:MAG: hypothetical protein ACRCYU_03080 [Nocardioides sp.]